MNIDPKLLKGLKYRDSERGQVLKDGQKVYQYTPRERELTPDDLMNLANTKQGESPRYFNDYGDKIVIVTTDGKKYELPKGKKEKTNE